MGYRWNYNNEIDNNYNIESLKNYLQSAQDDIERIKKYMLKIHEQAQKVLQTEFKYEAYLERRQDYGTKKIIYYVGVNHKPVLGENANYYNVYFKSYDHKRFAGTERKDAFKYAEELAKKYNCQIVKSGFPRKD